MHTTAGKLDERKPSGFFMGTSYGLPETSHTFLTKPSVRMS